MPTVAFASKSKAEPSVFFDGVSDGIVVLVADDGVGGDGYAGSGGRSTNGMADFVYDFRFRAAEYRGESVTGQFCDANGARADAQAGHSGHCRHGTQLPAAA